MAISVLELAFVEGQWGGPDVAMSVRGGTKKCESPRFPTYPG